MEYASGMRERAKPYPFDLTGALSPGGSLGFQFISIPFRKESLRSLGFPQNTFHLDYLLKTADQGFLGFAIMKNNI